MRLWPVLRVAFVVLACVTSGTLECGGLGVPEATLRGGASYGRMCAVCHGARGQGYAADFAPAVANAAFLGVATDSFLQTAIAQGRAGTTMSAWSMGRGGPLGPREVDGVIAYLRALGGPARGPLEDGAPHGDASRGEAAYAERCRGCHGDKGTGGPYVHIGGRDLLATAGNGMLRATIAEGRPGTPMAGFARELGPGGVEDVLAALRKWQTELPAQQRVEQAKPPPLPLGPVPLHPRGPEPVGFEATPATTSVDVVHRELERGARMGILDARAPSDYMGEHIAGAVSVPFYDPAPYLAQLPRDAWLVCYCACPHAESGQLAHKLSMEGFKKVTVLDEGLRVWSARKYGTSSGPDP